jgi:hypothetical protein
MKINTVNGWIEYARFCGSRCEAWGYGEAEIFNSFHAPLILKALARRGIRVIETVVIGQDILSYRR